MLAKTTPLTRWYGFAVAFFVLLSGAYPVHAQSIFAEANYSDSQYSALVEPISNVETDLRDAFTSYKMHRVTVRIVESYFGPVKKDAEIEIQINVPYIARNAYLEIMQSQFIVSFCGSNDGVYYTNRDYLVLPANEANLAEFRRLKEEGTDFDGEHDCTNSNLDLGPITIEPADQE